MSDAWVNIYAYGQKWPVTARTTYPSRSEARIGEAHLSDIRPLYRIHIIPKR